MVLWVFGYASLLWKTGFEYDERIIGFIKGYRRVFHLACYDHRGTPELPARVATLESDEDAVCAESSSKPVIPEVVVFMSTPDRVNKKYYLGAAPREEMALQIAMASGVYGRNCDYLFNLVDALRGIGHEDNEVIELANTVRKILCELKVPGRETTLPGSHISLMGHADWPLRLLPFSIHNSAPQLPQLSTIVPMSGLGQMWLNCTPCSPRLVRSQAM